MIHQLTLKVFVLKKVSLFSQPLVARFVVWGMRGSDLKVTDQPVNGVPREDAPLGTSFQRDGIKADPLTDYGACARSGREGMGVWLTDHLALSTSNSLTHHWPQTHGPKSTGKNLGKATEVHRDKIRAANMLQQLLGKVRSFRDNSVLILWGIESLPLLSSSSTITIITSYWAVTGDSLDLLWKRDPERCNSPFHLQDFRQKDFIQPSLRISQLFFNILTEIVSPSQGHERPLISVRLKVCCISFKGVLIFQCGFIYVYLISSCQCRYHLLQVFAVSSNSIMNHAMPVLVHVSDNWCQTNIQECNC